MCVLRLTDRIRYLRCFNTVRTVCDEFQSTVCPHLRDALANAVFYQAARQRKLSARRRCCHNGICIGFRPLCVFSIEPYVRPGSLPYIAHIHMYIIYIHAHSPPIASVHQFSHSECSLAQAELELELKLKPSRRTLPNYMCSRARSGDTSFQKTIVVHLHTYTYIIYTERAREREIYIYSHGCISIYHKHWLNRMNAI